MFLAQRVIPGLPGHSEHPPLIGSQNGQHGEAGGDAGGARGEAGRDAGGKRLRESS